MAAWLRAFLFTQLVEAPLYRYGLRVPWWRAVMASTITHPLVWLFVLQANELIESWLVRAVIAETFAVAIEAAWFARVVPWRRALVGSVIANGASVLMGTLAREYIDL